MRLLMTLDAVGGVWRYALDAAKGLARHDVDCLLLGFGPPPGAELRAERADISNATIVWRDLPLDWMADGPAALEAVGNAIAELAGDWKADLLHLNLPSQAVGLPDGMAVVVASHSCLPTWWDAMRATALPPEWEWHRERNAAGFRRARAVIVPSASHGAAVERNYGRIEHIHVVPNAISVESCDGDRDNMILAAGRWWDQAKNGAVLDAAAAHTSAPIFLAGAVEGPNGAAIRFDRARALGPLARPDLLALMRRAAIFSAPSRYEPFGLAALEAAMCGAALVLSDIPTFRELWSDAAIFVSPDDAGAWAAAFDALLAAPPLRRSLAAQARQRAAGFTLERQAASMHGVYSQVLASSGLC